MRRNEWIYATEAQVNLISKLHAECARAAFPNGTKLAAETLYMLHTGWETRMLKSDASAYISRLLDAKKKNWGR